MTTELTATHESRLALITIAPEKYVTEVFAPFHDALVKVKDAAKDATYDITTPTGMQVAVSHRAKFRAIRVEAEKARKERKAPILEIGKLLDSRYKALEAEISPLEDRFDADIKAEESRKEADKQARIAAERKRIADIQARISEMRNLPLIAAGRHPSDISQLIAFLVDTVPDASYEEFQDEANAVRYEALNKLAGMETEQRRIESEKEAARQEAVQQKLAQAEEVARLKAEREELARLRAETEARRKEEEHKAFVERARLEAELKAEYDRLTAEQAKADEETNRQRLEQARQAEIERAEIAAQVNAAKEAQEAAQAQFEADRAEFARRCAELEESLRVEDAAEELNDLEQKASSPFSIAPFVPPSRTIDIDRPTDLEIILDLSMSFGVTEERVLEWLSTFDIEAARKQLAQEAA